LELAFTVPVLNLVKIKCSSVELSSELEPLEVAAVLAMEWRPQVVLFLASPLKMPLWRQSQVN